MKNFWRKSLGLGMTSLMVMSTLAACGDKTGGDTGAVTSGSNSGSGTSAATGTGETGGTTTPSGEVLKLSMFMAMPGAEINDGENDIQKIIADKTGVSVKETWLTGQTAAEAVGTIIASGTYPDLIDGGDGMVQLYDAGLLVAWDDYIEKYPNLKNYYTPEEWDMFRQDDGHIYWCNVFQNTKGNPTSTTHNDEAFWIQARVLAWDNYPKIETLDEYFDLLERYAAANPTTDDGMQVIPYTCLCDDWRYFCIENAPEFLDGYPNDGSVIVDKTDMNNPKIVDYNTTPTAKRYFQKLNEEYAKGIVDKEFATQTYDEYISKLSNGNVLGMCDQYWDFMTINDTFKQTGLDEKGCNFVPLGLTIDKGMDNRWHTYGDTLNNSSGVGVLTTNPDIEKTFEFLNAMLDQDIHNLRFWGVEGTDYLVDDQGLFYRTPEMRMQWADPSYQAKHRCVYSYLPQYGGTSDDGKNANLPEEQPSEFFESLATPLQDCFNAYGVTTYPGMIGSIVEENAPWFPMWSFSNNLTTETPGGVAWTKMGQTKHEWLPKVVMSSNFESDWAKYMDAYNACNPQDFLDEMQAELDRRIGK
ncbi:MAG: sugar ABC transporter substrate-binding protein [Lachnospiraceae bacterium]|nr:sugar ABC transporter substrate-binding protein [Lachnospiraceae bacterium]MBO6297467.1 sugar ABC transporter substrate-binding protein [Lachnospiraceae bacterium]MBP3296361.1 sugar ABC transporter substrate-binding protein [Lachnospiraceae bacterium]